MTRLVSLHCIMAALIQRELHWGQWAESLADFWKLAVGEASSVVNSMVKSGAFCSGVKWKWSPCLMTFPRNNGSNQKLTASMASGSAGETMNLR